MATTARDLGWIEVPKKIEPRALAGSIAADATERIAETLVYVLRACEEDGRELNDRQHMTLVDGLLRCWDGFEDATYGTILQAVGMGEHDAR